MSSLATKMDTYCMAYVPIFVVPLYAITYGVIIIIPRYSCAAHMDSLFMFDDHVTTL